VTSTTGDQQLAAALGFSGIEIPDANGRLTASNDLVGSMLASIPADLFMSDGTTLSISGTSGSSGNYSWSLVDGRLSLSGTSPSIAISATNASKRDQAGSLGFLGSDLTLTRNGSKLTLVSQANDTTRTLADGSASVSIASNSLEIGAAPEDFIVALSDTSTNVMRRISADLGTAGPASPLLPDLKIKILSASTLEILDAGSGVSLANRTWKADEPVSYLGLTFTMTGAAAVGDVFNVINDPTRTGDNRNAIRIAELATKSIFGPKQGTFQSVYTSVAAEMGSTVSSASMVASSSKQQASDLQSAYEAKTGVNLDREASDLIRYQQAYQAAAQVVSTARDLFQTILKIF
jgi:flagellar hook-associated protein 1 FlgK